MRRGALLFQGKDWSFETLQRIYDAIEPIAEKEFGLEVFPNQIEVITVEQMLDAYASTGMPIFYKHWSFGKRFVQHQTIYHKGLQDLAYEIVINSNPCISYIMEGSSATMQALVMAHAAFGHNHFFKNNYQFRQWTAPESILDYLTFARNYITACEERYGHAEVERLLDAAHALMAQGIDRSPHKRPLDLQQEEKRERDRMHERDRLYNDLWRTVPGRLQSAVKAGKDRQRALLGLPQENILYFLEKAAPRLKPWQREVLRIVRLIAQYFYPQQLTKVMNEGCATYCHYSIMTRLHETGQIDDGSFLEFLHSHTSVVRQPMYHEPSYGGVNPYALGFDMMRDIARIARDPTPEDKFWFPDLAGCGDEMGALRNVWANYRDDSFVAQFLSPALMRKWRLFHVVDQAELPYLEVATIHNERGYRELRRRLAAEYDAPAQSPHIEVVDVDLAGSRKLILHHQVVDSRFLEPEEAALVMKHLAFLWGYEVLLQEVDSKNGEVIKEHSVAAETAG
jgi:stage V sporulation protein R